MNYLEWNDLIASFFFNEDIADKEVYLYITKEDIINIGKEKLSDKSNLETWQDFLCAVKVGYNNKVDDTDIIETLLWVFEYYKEAKNQNREQFIYPIYIAYLVLFILPLTNEEQLNINSFYERVNLFLSQNELPQLLNQTNRQNWNKVWEDLEYWSIYEKNCELGYFEIHKFGNPNWRFVSKPLSQCLIKLSSIKKLPTLFYQNNILPNSNIKEEKIRSLLINSSQQLDLNTNLFRAIRNNDEIGNLLIKIIKRFYDRWNGEEIYYSKREIDVGIVKPWTLATIRLGLDINFNDGKIDFFIRIFSHNEFPEELIFNESIIVKYEINNWSKKITVNPIELLITNHDFVLEDRFNKWKAIFKCKNIVFFRSGVNYSLNGWIETDTLELSDEILLFCNETGLKEVKQYCNQDITDYLEQLDFDGLNRLYLFRVKKNLQDDLLKKYDVVISSITGCSFNNLLKLNRRDYLQDGSSSVIIPQIYNESKVIIKYPDADEEIELKNIRENPRTFKLSKQILKDINIEILLKNGQQFKISEFRVINSFYNSTCDLEIPFRNSWAEIAQDDIEYLWHGNEFNNELSENSLYDQSKHHFLSELDTSVSAIIKLDLRRQVIYNSCKDIMLSFISSSGKLSFEKYFTTFEQIVTNHNSIEKISNFNYNKHLSLRYLESLGHIDIDYISPKIVINKPQIILIPNKSFVGREAVLIGARYSDLINDLIRKSKVMGIKVSIENSIDSNTGLEFIVPQIIRLSVQGDRKDNFGEERLQNLCNDLKIIFNPSILLQPILLITSPKIIDYEGILIEDEEQDYEWARQIFNPLKLKFEVSTNHFDKNLCLLKYHFTNYHIRYKLWQNQKCYKDNNVRNKGIDPEWGRYFILYKLGKNVLFFDEKARSLAVPISVPLPRLINKALTLMSGYVPDPKIINGNTYEVYRNLIPSLTYNIFSQLGQSIQEYNLNEV